MGQALLSFLVVLHAAVIFSVEVVVTFFTGIIIVNRMRQALVMDRTIVALHYVLHGPFLLDFFVAATLWAEVSAFLSPMRTCLDAEPDILLHAPSRHFIRLTCRLLPGLLATSCCNQGIAPAEL